MSNQRISNAVTYVSPNFSGFKAAVNYGFGEVAGSNRANRYFGGGLTYDNGPLSLGLSAERQNNVGGNVTTAIQQNNGADVTAWALGGSYNFGVVKLAGAYKDNKAKFADGSKDKMKGYYIGLSAPVGAAGKLKADQFALGYVHNLSKRTAVYGTYAYIKNKNNEGFNMGLNQMGGATLKTNGSQQGLQVGVRHAF